MSRLPTVLRQAEVGLVETQGEGAEGEAGLGYAQYTGSKAMLHFGGGNHSMM